MILVTDKCKDCSYMAKRYFPTSILDFIPREALAKSSCQFCFGENIDSMVEYQEITDMERFIDAEVEEILRETRQINDLYH